jgi:hypothetical protein
MKKIFFFIVIYSVWFNTGWTQYTSLWKDEEWVIRRLNLRQEAQLSTQTEQSSWTTPTGKQRSVKKAVLFSLIVPGGGQLYANSYLKGVLFLAIEAASWITNITYNQKGDDKDKTFKTFAEEHWSEYRYWSYVAYRASSALENPPFTVDELSEVNEGKWFLIPEDQYNPALVTELREIEGQILSFSHRLPETKTQQYYEMIGKYPAQFGYAWDDASFLHHYSGYTNDYTPNNNFYMDMRDEANRFYNIASYGTMTALVNHVVSAIDAGFTARRFNRNNTLRVEMSYQNRLYLNEYVNLFGINIKW